MNPDIVVMMPCGCVKSKVIDGRTWLFPHEGECPENPWNQPMELFFSNASDPTDFSPTSPETDIAPEEE